MSGDRSRAAVSIRTSNYRGSGEVEERGSSQRHEPRRAVAEIRHAAAKMAGRGNCGVPGDSGGLLFSREVAGADFVEACSCGPANFSGYLAFPQPFDRFI